MTDLVACLTYGKGSWKEVIKIIRLENWENIYLVTDEFGVKTLKLNDSRIKFVIINPKQEVSEIRESVFKQLRDKLKGDVALNITSGSGKEHMALLAALLRIGIGIRFIVPGKEGVEEV